MARILITSGPTRQYLDPVRYLTNASSGRMGVALTQASLDLGHEVVVVTGPVHLAYPSGSRVVTVESTEQMLAACNEWFPKCDGLIGAAAPCDYQPTRFASEKISKTGAPFLLELKETPDVLATLGQMKTDDQWAVGFALETTNPRARAQSKLKRKQCDMIVLNGPESIEADGCSVELIDRSGQVVATFAGQKNHVAKKILDEIQNRLIDCQPS